MGLTDKKCALGCVRFSDMCYEGPKTVQSDAPKPTINLRPIRERVEHYQRALDAMVEHPTDEELNRAYRATASAVQAHGLDDVPALLAAVDRVLALDLLYPYGAIIRDALGVQNA